MAAVNEYEIAAHRIFRLGNLDSQRGEIAEAVPEYQQALRLSPNVPDAPLPAGEAYVHLGNEDLAQKEFQLHQQFYERNLAQADTVNLGKLTQTRHSPNDPRQMQFGLKFYF